MSYVEFYGPLVVGHLLNPNGTQHDVETPVDARTVARCARLSTERRR